jgi:hypothetical protein
MTLILCFTDENNLSASRLAALERKDSKLKGLELRGDLPLKLRHATVVGVADPTGSIPQDCVFITGPMSQWGPDQAEVVITRSPCTEGADAKVLKVITHRSQLVGSSEDAFKTLSAMSFGSVVFPPGTSSLVSSINNSDLDGDEFMIIRDPEIVIEAKIYTTNLNQRLVSRVPSPKGMSVTNHRHIDKDIEVQCEHDGKSVWQSISAIDDKFAVWKYAFEKGLLETWGFVNAWFEIVQDSIVLNRSLDINRLVQEFNRLHKDAVIDPNLGPSSEKGMWHS